MKAKHRHGPRAKNIINCLVEVGCKGKKYELNNFQPFLIFIGSVQIQNNLTCNLLNICYFFVLCYLNLCISRKMSNILSNSKNFINF